MTYVSYSPTTSTTATSSIGPSSARVRVTSWDGQVYDLPVRSVTLDRNCSTIDTLSGYSWSYTTGTTLTFTSTIRYGDYDTLTTLASNDGTYQVIVDGVARYQDSGRLTHLTSNVGWNAGVEVQAEVAMGSGYCPESEEDRAAREAQAAEWQRQADERQAQRDKAIIEAEALLWACLDIVQRGELAITQSFIVTGSSGKRYRIRRGYAGNVEDFEGETIYSYCGHAYVDGMPEADQMLAQKFALETDEENYLQIANASYLRPGTDEERERAREGPEARIRRIA